jgi:hypothetical protein
MIQQQTWLLAVCLARYHRAGQAVVGELLAKPALEAGFCFSDEVYGDVVSPAISWQRPDET